MALQTGCGIWIERDLENINFLCFAHGFCGMSIFSYRTYGTLRSNQVHESQVQWDEQKASRVSTSSGVCPRAMAHRVEQLCPRKKKDSSWISIGEMDVSKEARKEG